MKTTAMIHAFPQDRELAVTTTHHREQDQATIVAALEAQDVQPTRVTVLPDGGRVTTLKYAARVGERGAISFLAQLLKDAGFAPFLARGSRRAPRAL